MTLDPPFSYREFGFAIFCIAIGIFFLADPSPRELAGATLRGTGFITLGCWFFAAHFRVPRASLIGWAAGILLAVGYTLRYGDMLYRIGAWIFG